MKARKRTLPVLNAGDLVACDRLRAKLSIPACVLRWRKANTRTRAPKITNGWNHYGGSREAEALVSCVKCAVGRERTRNQERTAGR